MVNSVNVNVTFALELADDGDDNDDDDEFSEFISSKRNFPFQSFVFLCVSFRFVQFNKVVDREFSYLSVICKCGFRPPTQALIFEKPVFTLSI